MTHLVDYSQFAHNDLIKCNATTASLSNQRLLLLHFRKSAYATRRHTEILSSQLAIDQS